MSATCLSAAPDEEICISVVSPAKEIICESVQPGAGTEWFPEVSPLNEHVHNETVRTPTSSWLPGIKYILFLTTTE
jgi:hypothetical protein